MMENKEDFKKKFDKVMADLNLKYNDIDLYFEAFTHSSYANEAKLVRDYDRLEFLGDSILDFLVSEYLYNTYNLEEGEMTKIRAEYVCEPANADYTKEMHLDELVLVGVGAQKANEQKRDSVLGDVFESFLGALYLDEGIDAVRKVLSIWVFPKIKGQTAKFFVDYKTRLQENMQAERGESPIYIIVNETGPSHDKTFEALVKIDGVKLGHGTGKTKKEAEQAAAKAALEKLAK